MVDKYVCCKNNDNNNNKNNKVTMIVNKNSKVLFLIELRINSGTKLQ